MGEGKLALMEQFVLDGQYLTPMETKYDNLSINKEAIFDDLKRLINQIWKLLPMRENNENWKKHLEGVILEFIGLQEIFVEDELDFLIVISKLEGIKNSEIDFFQYRSEIFSIIHILGDKKNGLTRDAGKN